MKRILVIQTASIGDVILATSLVESLHRERPETAIDLLVKKGNESLFTGHPYLRQVIAWDKHTGKYSGLFRIIRRNRKEHYDLIINIQRFLSSGLITVLSGARETRGFTKNPLSRLFTRRFGHRIGSVHEVERNHDLLTGVVTGSPARPALYPQPEDLALAGRLAPGTCYTLSPASLWFTKQYPAEKWAELIRLIPEEAGVFLLGSKSDAALCESIMAQSSHPGTVNLAGKLTLLQSAAVMRCARMNFTNDSAPMHLAAAVDAPVTAIFCSTVPEFGFGPLSSDAAVVQIAEPLACRPCGLHGRSSCPEGHFRCAYGIAPGQLTARL